MDFDAGCVQLWVYSTEPPGNIFMRIGTAATQQQMEVVIWKVTLIGIQSTSAYMY